MDTQPENTPSSRRSSLTFEVGERLRQTAFLDEMLPARTCFQNSPYRVDPSEKAQLLAPMIRSTAAQYFCKYKISWHRHANHALSSQQCCLNFLMPLAEQPDRLSQLIGHALDIRPPNMMPVEDGPDGRPWYVGFEWNGGGHDYLNESKNGKPLQRGANSTSADAVVRFCTDQGPEFLLIEWKYTEKYGAPIPKSGNSERCRRYAGIAFNPKGPLKTNPDLNLTDFFYEPFYQLLRQQMLAHQMQLAQHDGARRVRVLHISPAGNHALHRVTSPPLRELGCGTDAFDLFRSLLVRPNDFVDRTIEELFLPTLREAGEDDPWASYLTRRYRFLSDVASNAS
ncbi:hypothetical protein I8G32_02517 [Rhodopseudomonas palustris]|nr:hypothetical protein B1S06_23210 [Rhodopseudomonas palustris]PPQ42267.1 hypothetical protein CKO39_17325 [Rhodopseudomonas palustris]QQM03970.1 hypothetical protein I8G32_02517 [Rhodopseudomonas palustris]RJF62036.1 hypothetical protein D4Q71_20135 [Rhodopseudomonas palustris]CAE27890.1 hypothetical protein RPA2449 [Rhodopseudomonas palustris CGA009]